MRLERIQTFLKEKELPYRYSEPGELGSIDLDYKGLKFHIWEFHDGEYGVESNIRNTARFEDFTGDYEAQIISIMQTWFD